MAAVRTMMSAAREEAAILSTEMATAARTAVVEAGGVERVVSPVGLRQAAELGVKEAENALSQHLSLAHAHIQPTTVQTSFTSLTTSLPSGGSATISSTRTVVAQALEQDLGVTLKEVMSNATQTGVEEQMDELVDVAKKLAAEAASAA